MQIIAFADEAARFGGRIGIHLAEIGLHTAKINPGHFAVLGTHCVGGLPPTRLQEDGYGFHRRAAFLDSDGVLNG